MGLSRRTSRRAVLFAVPLWFVSLAAGAAILGRHASVAGDSARAPAVWPDGSPLAPVRTPDRWTVVLAAHPRCPCTRASADELRTALAGVTEPHELIVLAFHPPGDERFAETGVIRALAAAPNARVIPDESGRASARFGGLTSGWVAVYDPAGALRFAGGVTPSRAHTGPNTGAAAVRALLTDTAPPADQAPVFGCPITDNPAALLGACNAEGDPPCRP